MAIYMQPSVQKRTRFDEMGYDMLIVQGPNLDATLGPWSDVLLYYWATQMSFFNNAGTQMGGGHIGLQAYCHPWLSTKYSVINWGVYDDTIGNYATFRTSQPITDDTFIDLNSGPSWGFDWSYNEWLRFRVFKSPKQDWLAAEIRPGDGQVAPYVGTDQQTDEVAYRGTVENLTRASVPIEMWDVLVKQAATSKPMGDFVTWTEPIAQASYPSAIDNTWPYSPEMRFRNFNTDGYRTQTSFSINYKAGSANSNVSAVSATPGYYRQQGGVTRTNADGAILAVPTGLWDSPQPNVTPAPADLSARVATPRPWF